MVRQFAEEGGGVCVALCIKARRASGTLIKHGSSRLLRCGELVSIVSAEAQLLIWLETSGDSRPNNDINQLLWSRLCVQSEGYYQLIDRSRQDNYIVQVGERPAKTTLQRVGAACPLNVKTTGHGVFAIQAEKGLEVFQVKHYWGAVYLGSGNQHQRKGT